MTDKIYARIISSILLACAIAALSLTFIASSTFEAVLSISLTFVAGSLGLAVARDAK
jgi:hypothetical protein